MKITNSTQYNLPEGAKARIEIGAGDVNYWRCNAIQFSPDGTQLAVASSTWTQTSTNNKIQIYNADSREELEVRIRPVEQQSSIAFSPDGKILASGGYDNEVHLWNVSTGARLSTFMGIHKESMVLLSVQMDAHSPVEVRTTHFVCGISLQVRIKNANSQDPSLALLSVLMARHSQPGHNAYGSG